VYAISITIKYNNLQKLQGYEDPNGEAMSVAGQVKLLINEAQDPDNLCKIFPGWSPWL
jgi:serine-protein kinase ATM